MDAHAGGGRHEGQLPIAGRQREILYLVEGNAVVIVVGQTGCGKSTHLPLYLHEAGWSSPTRAIACTQPRRVAAAALATHVAAALPGSAAATVGYCFRFEDTCRPGVTRIKYMTDGMLFREAMFDPLLMAYSVVIVDEAHERSIYTDLLLGLLKKILRRRADLRIVICSATLDVAAFAAFFTTTHPPPVVAIEGRAFPVDVYYLPRDRTDWQDGAASVAQAVAAIERVHMSEAKGDLLVFLSGRDQIEGVMAALLCEPHASAVSPRSGQRIAPFALHASQSTADQEAAIYGHVKSSSALRKVILSTNVAETSLTIPNIAYVIDGGLVKERIYDPRLNADVLVTSKVSRASADQRAGRAGRLGPGRAFCLYSERNYTEDFDAQALGEVERANLAPVVLQLYALGIDNVLAFDLLRRPDPDRVAAALEHLLALGAIDVRGRLTRDIGHPMADLALDPLLGAMFVAAWRLYGCAPECAAIAAMLSVLPVFQNDRQGAAYDEDAAKAAFALEEGDLFTYLNILTRYREALADGGGGARWCSRHGLCQKALERAAAIAGLLERTAKRHFAPPLQEGHCRGDKISAITRAIVAGFFANAATLQPDGSYRSIRYGESLLLHVHPSSVLFKRRAPCVLYYQVMETTRMYMREVTAIDVALLPQLAPKFYTARRR